MRQVHFHQEAFGQFTGWAAEDPNLFERLTRLVVETARNPFEGIGKPEPLKHQLKGYWSRRINSEHRLVYKATSEGGRHRIVPIPLLRLPAGAAA